MSVLLNNYKNIERLLDKYAYISDYWLHDLFDEEHPTDKANEDIMKSTLKALANYLYDNTDMQHFASVGTRSRQFDHKTYGTKQEKHYKVAIEEYKNLFEGTGIPIDIIAGLLTAGTYYPILHRKRSTFLVWIISGRKIRNACTVHLNIFPVWCSPRSKSTTKP